ncbi:chemotaxis protein CheW [Massilia arenosa]|uniref:Chemotaxis protein CheW n=1 Tax=Zemynaea arenosa TaxID=2561931 RepID=A0A4Y9RRK1_9BURK|nr:chemotaxis protein CheW [Massilia arenosa]TFW11513.1 chemotaxis protein CheW [Massilia arenosa]
MNISASPRNGTTDFLSFRLGGMEYGLDFRKVHELRVLKSLERFTTEGMIVSGVVMSRGVIMPLVDMRAAFGGAAGEPDPLTDVIVLQLDDTIMGMLVDGVTDVVALRPDQIAPLPGVQADYLLGMGQADGRRLILVDIDRLMSIRRRSTETAK